MQRSLTQVGIPVFFYISGFSTTYYNTEKKSFCLFFKQRLLRLIIPYILGVLIILIPRLYFLQDFSYYSRYDEITIEYNFFIYYAKMIPYFYLKMSWLWFLPALFIDSMINYPLLKFS
jgi:glucans biosynthesis protein C